jgi:hypothetical protein
MDSIDAYIAAAAQEKAEAIESACELMLVTPGEFGVRVDEWDDSGWAVRVDADVEPMCVSTFRHEGPKPDANV